MSEVAARIATSSGVIGVNGKRVVYHALNFTKGSVSGAGKMIYQGGILYVDSSVIGVEMPKQNQVVAEAEMVIFVQSQIEQ